MRILLDSSVLLSNCGSSKSLSRLIMEIAPARGRLLISASYCHVETSKNIGKLGEEAILRWPETQSKVEWVPNALTSRKPLLVTLDKGDFGIVGAGEFRLFRFVLRSRLLYF